MLVLFLHYKDTKKHSLILTFLYVFSNKMIDIQSIATNRCLRFHSVAFAQSVLTPARNLNKNPSRIPFAPTLSRHIPDTYPTHTRYIRIPHEYSVNTPRISHEYPIHTPRIPLKVPTKKEGCNLSYNPRIKTF